MTTCETSIELGAFVLHALAPDEDEQVRRHVATCEECRDEVGELSFTASLLSLLTLEDLEQLDADNGGSAPEAGVRPAAGRRPRRRTMLAVAAALAATAVIPAAHLLHQPDSAPAATVVHATDGATHVTAAVSLARQDSGTRVHLNLSGAYPQGWCALVAHSRSGRTDTAATWRADADGAADVDGTTAIPTSQLDELDVVTGSGRVLVRIPVDHQES
jgi:hypothetical protein